MSALALLVIAVGALFAGPAAATPTNPGSEHRNVHVCDKPAAGDAGCHAVRHDRLDRSGRTVPNATPSGFGPASIRSAYGLGASSSGGRTVAVVDAYDLPTA